MPYPSPIRLGGLPHISAGGSFFMLLLPSRFPSNGLPITFQQADDQST